MCNFNHRITWWNFSSEPDSAGNDLTVSLEGNVATNHVVQQNSQRPDCARVAVIHSQLYPLWWAVHSRTCDEFIQLYYNTLFVRLTNILTRPQEDSQETLWKEVGREHTAPLYGAISSQKRSGMARVVEGSHSFTCRPTRLSTNGMNPTCLCRPSLS